MNDDTRLMKRVINNDMAAFEEIYRKYYADVYRFAYMITNQEVTSEDIAQSVFLKVVKCAHQYHATGSVKAWIIQITRSISLNLIKHNSFCTNMEFAEIMNIPGDEHDFVNVEFLSLLEGLSPMMQEIIVLHVVYRFRHKEIATMLSKSPSAVRQQYKRAMDWLKKSYRDSIPILKGDTSYDKA